MNKLRFFCKYLRLKKYTGSSTTKLSHKPLSACTSMCSFKITIHR